MSARKMAESRSGPQWPPETGARAASVRAPQGWACLLGVFSLLLSVGPSRATTHWVVTEDGKIQQQVDSPMNLKHPHDLVILMRQETTVGYLKELEKHLVAQRIHIEENEDRDTGLEQRHYKDDPDCVLAKVPLGDMDLYDGTYMPLEDKNIKYCNKIKVVALKITSNINVLIKDLFHNPPSYKSTVTLSWKPVQKTEAGQKRSSEDSSSSSPPKKPIVGPKRDSRQIYNPPSGKYSGSLGNFSYEQRGGFRGGRGRGWGGRGNRSRGRIY